MLVLQRKLGEEVFIGDDVVVKVLSIRGRRVKLGFRCPPDVPVRRRELELPICEVVCRSARETVFEEGR